MTTKLDTTSIITIERDPEQEARWPERRALATQVSDLEAQLKEASKGLKWSKEHVASEKVIAKRSARIASLEFVLADARGKVAALDAIKEMVKEARDNRRRDFLAHIEDAVRATFETPLLGIRMSSRSLEIQVLTGETKTIERDGKTITYSVEKFAFDADIYFPELKSVDWKPDAYTARWSGATVSWGSFGSMDLVTAREIQKLHDLAIEIAEAVEDFFAENIKEAQILF